MRLVLSICALIMVSCAALPKNPERELERQVNACLPAAITMRESLRRYDVWAQVLEVHWIDGQSNKTRGHAYAVYLYPPGKNKLWAYDRDWGSIRVRAYKDDAEAVARSANASRALFGSLTSAEYIR